MVDVLSKTYREKVSVIIPTYGRPEYLENALLSVLKQDYSNIEIIVIDDNPNNEAHQETIKLLAPYISKEKIIYYHDGENRGGSLARNKGIELSTGFYVTFLDDDDTYDENKISKQVKHIEEEGLDVSVCDMHFFSKGRLRNVSNCYARVEDSVSFVLNGNAYTPMILSKKTDLMDIGGFTDTPRYQDHVLMLKFFINNKKVGHLPVKLFTHNDHDGSRITNTKKFEKAYYIRKSFEAKLIPKMSETAYKQYVLKDLLICSKIFRFNGENIKAYKNIMKSLKRVSGLPDLIRVFKTFIRITFFKNKPI